MESEKIDFLLGLIDFSKTSRQRIKSLELIEDLNGYDLVFILCLIIRSKFSGNLIVISEQNEFSGVIFDHGDIVKIDYPDQENLIGNLIVQEEIITKEKLDEITANLPIKLIGQYLIEKKYITKEQLQLLLFKQSKFRLAKYMDSSLVAVNFNFNKEQVEAALVSHSGYYEILYAMIFQYYQPEWLTKYSDYYSKKFFSISDINEELSVLESFDLIWPACEKLQKSSKKCLSHKELIARIAANDLEGIRLLHFLVLTGVVLVVNEMINTESPTPTPVKITSEGATVPTNDLPTDLKLTKKYLLDQKPFDAFAVLNKYSSLINSNELIHFYFIWIKIHGAYYNNYMLSTEKISAELDQINAASIPPGDYYYVKALLEAQMKNTDNSLMYYSKALANDVIFVSYAIRKRLN